MIAVVFSVTNEWNQIFGEVSVKTEDLSFSMELNFYIKYIKRIYCENTARLSVPIAKVFS